MTNDEVLAALREDCVFELSCQNDKWRAFYRARLHYDISEHPSGCYYRSVVRKTIHEAVQAALEAWTIEQTKAKLLK